MLKKPLAHIFQMRYHHKYLTGCTTSRYATNLHPLFKVFQCPAFAPEKFQ